MRLIQTKFSWGNFSLFLLAFILSTIVGTVSHEAGHVFAAYVNQCEAELHFASMGGGPCAISDKLEDIYSTYTFEIENHLNFPKKSAYEEGLEKVKIQRLWITAGGPIQTMLTGLIGLFILVYRRKFQKSAGLSVLDWIAVFLSLFWLRQVFNVVMSISDILISGGEFYFSGDEPFLSSSLGLWYGTLPLITAGLGLIVSIIVIFYFIPIKYRLSFILAGLVGGVLGFWIWMKMLGPILLP